MAEGGEEKERKSGTLTTAGGTISFIGALVALAKNGNLRALQKLLDIEKHLHNIAQGF